MVNETNKPAEETLETEQLEQRLAASNQAIADMQAEHRQLLEEMEQLRRRAEDLQRIREQQEREDQEKLLQYQQNNVAVATETLEKPENSVEAPEQTQQENADDANPEEADYIKEKLAEIARLKAQFKRVQHMINTTELIENHISKNENKSEVNVSKEKKGAKPAAINSPAIKTTTANVSETSKIVNPLPLAATTPIDMLTLPDMPTMADLEAATTADEKEQLIATMLNMFQDFSSDLRSQADNLRAERERIKELKESIIRARREPPK